MKRALRLATGLGLFVIVTACSDSVRVPTAPEDARAIQTPAPNPLPSAGGSGSITMLSVSPSSGARLLVRECEFGKVVRTCADGWLGDFTVSLDRDMTHAVLTVSFYDNGGVLCGYAADTQKAVPAHHAVTFRPTWISLSDEFATFSTPCQLPATTSRIVATLWSDSDWTTQVTQEFATTYTFVR